MVEDVEMVVVVDAAETNVISRSNLNFKAKPAVHKYIFLFQSQEKTKTFKLKN